MFTPRLALASLSGRSTASWARRVAPTVGAAFLGGIALDGPTRDAARALVARGRSEFLPLDPVGFIDEQLQSLTDTDLQAAFNVRAVDPDATAEAARVCRDRQAVIEINAHCRQPEMCARGAGQRLLHDPDRLAEHIGAAAATGATVSVKVRAEVPGVDLPALADRIEAAGASAIHVDAMDTESIIEPICSRTDLFVIANNGIRDGPTARTYLEYGADAVSIARASDDPAVLDRVRQAVGGHRSARDVVG